RLQERFGLDKKQTDAILEMKLRRLTGLSREEIEKELAELRAAIEYFRSILRDKNLLHKVIKDELQDVKKRFGTPRRTKIMDEAKEIDVEDLIAEENMVVTITQAGYVKRLPVSTYRQQKRGGKGMQGVNLKESDFVEHLFVASTHDYMLFFTTKGRVYRLKVYEIPEATRYARGTAIVNLLRLEKGEGVAAVISTKDFPKNEFLMFATEQGMVKKTSMELYDRTRAGGLIAINLHDKDRLISVKRVAPGDKIIMVSSAGKAICWEADEVRSMGRDTAGVRGMTVDGKDVKVLGMEIAQEGADLLVITERGYGKRTPVAEYPVHHRGGQGVYTIIMTEKKGLLSMMKVVREEDELMLISEAGVVVRTQVNGISQQGRQTQGVHIMNVADKDRVVGAASGSDDKKRSKKGAADAGQEELDLSDTFDDEA
ncbi:MAG: DNA gyrase subunit A, partial [Eggerthellaceae bacterium]|nr:DNA gyrase subunit A [Eggerthellaceae bacterium]